MDPVKKRGRKKAENKITLRNYIKYLSDDQCKVLINYILSNLNLTDFNDMMSLRSSLQKNDTNIKQSNQE